MSYDRSSASAAALFETDDGAIVARDDFLRALSAAGVQACDVCLVHTSLLAFGRPQSDGATIVAELGHALLDAVSPAGTLILPTFSYSFCKGEVFNVQETPSKMGAINEYFRKQPGVVRTAHPIFSCAIVGEKQREFLDVDDDCFGPGSLFGKLHAANGKIVFLGIGLEVCTFIHYVEQAHGVPYRYIKTFSGTVVDRGVARSRQCTYFVRHLDANVVLSLDRFERELRAKGQLRSAPIGIGQVLAVDAQDAYATAWDMLNADIFSLLREPPRLARECPEARI